MGEDRQREVAGTFSLRREGKLSTPDSVVVLDGNKAVVETLRTPYRYYVVPALTGFGGIWASELVAARLGSGGFIWGVAGAVVGVFAGMVIALALQDRKHEKVMTSVARGEREPSSDIVVKKGKVNVIETEDEGGRKSLHIVTPKEDFELLGGEDDVGRVRDALT